MAISGTIFEITNLQGFLTSTVLNPDNPNPDMYRRAEDLRVHITSITNLPFGFFPNFSVNGETNRNGQFSIDTSSLPRSFDVFILVYKKVGEVDVPFINTTIPIYNPVYRSDSFSLGNISDLRLYFGTQNISNENGIAQNQINEQIREARTSINDLERLSAFIGNREISVRGEGRGAEVKFNIKLSPYTGSDLDKFVKHKIEDFDIDLPGPDFITGLCVDEDEIERQIRRRVNNIVNQMNSQILNGIIQVIADQSGLNQSIILNYFNDNLTLTFGNFRYPIVAT